MHIFAFCFWCIGKQASWLYEEVKKRTRSMKSVHSFTVKINSETSELTHVHFPSKAAAVHIVYVCQKSQTLSNASRCNRGLFKLCIIKKVENDALCWAYSTRPFDFKYHQRTHCYYLWKLASGCWNCTFTYFVQWKVTSCRVFIYPWLYAFVDLRMFREHKRVGVE